MQTTIVKLTPRILATWALLWLSGFCLRISVLAAPPLALDISADFPLGSAGIAALTMLPLLAIALGALPAAGIIKRMGPGVSIILGIVLMAAFSSARGWAVDTTTLLTLSALMGLAIALFQTALPSAVGLWASSYLALGSAIYLNGMMMGELASAGLTLPLVMPWVGNDWREAINAWSWIALAVAALVTIKVAAGPKHASSPTTEAALPRLNDALSWRFGTMLGSSILLFYVINAFASPILAERDELDRLPTFLLLFNSTPLIASCLLLYKSQWIGQRTALWLWSLAGAIGIAGFTVLTGWLSFAFAALTGLSATIQLILLLSLPPILLRGQAVARLTAGMTFIGYGLAFVLPLLGGWLADALGGLSWALLPAVMLAGCVLGLVGDESRYQRES